MKPILVSGIQPTGRLHLGNYLGALKNFVELQNSGKYQCYFFIADLHSLTENFDPNKKQDQILELTADFIAAGIDPKKSVIFQQSQIPAHSELAWILNTITPMGELERMTQFKDKAKIKSIEELIDERFKTGKDGKPKIDASAVFQSENAQILTDYGNAPRASANVGLFDYPVLMAADIILYDAKFVPVGDDQLQHLELTRTLARKFNSKFGETFVEPQPILTKAARVMSLGDPMKKMSKSQPETCLFLDDSPEAIKQKVMRAVTDSGSEIKYDKANKAGISNLLTIYSEVTGEAILHLEKEFADKRYSDFKAAVAEAVATHFAPYRKKKAALIKRKASLKTVLRAGSAKAAARAIKKIAEVKKKTGLA